MTAEARGLQQAERHFFMLMYHFERDQAIFFISNLQGITKMMSTNILPETDLLDQI